VTIRKAWLASFCAYCGEETTGDPDAHVCESREQRDARLGLALVQRLRDMADAPWGSPNAKEAILACADRLEQEIRDAG